MPYAMMKDLPPAVKEMPSHAQEVWMAAFNSAYEEYKGDEERAFKVAWAAVSKAGYKQDEQGKWVKEAYGSGSWKDFCEPLYDTLKEATVDRQHLTLQGVCLLGPTSRNGRVYPERVMLSSARMFEGKKCFLNHADGERDIRELAGRFKNVRVVGGKVMGDMQVLSTHADTIMSLAEQMPDAVGFSLNARGKIRREHNWDVVEELQTINSVDLVTEPGTTRSLFENVQKETDMDWKELSLAALQAERPDLLEAHSQVVLRESKQGEAEQAESKALREDNAKLKARVLELEAKEKAAEVGAKITEAVKDLPAEIATDAFRESLMPLAEEARTKLIESVRAAVKAASQSAPKSEEKKLADDQSKGQPLEMYVSTIRKG